MRVSRARAPLVIGSAAFAIAAIAGATALPSRARSDVAHVPLPRAEPVRYLGSAAAHPVEPEQAAPADPGAQRFAGRVGENLTESLKSAGVPERQGREYVWVLARAIDLAGGLSVEDRFDLVIERSESGKLGRLLYAGLDRVARADVELLKWTDGKQIIWVNGDGVGGTRDSAMGLPVAGKVTSGFGSRFHPILGHARMHRGIDLRATYGAPIAAAADGRVVAAGWHGGYGRQVSIAHGGGIETTYAHMSRMAVSAGQAVRKGQVIGYVGSSGLSTGPHVHYEVYKNGRVVNPMSVKTAAGPAQLEGEKLRAFNNALRELLMLRAG
ncbi:MAG TPA: M23 family metallopeptidase [Sphingomicrobium sp.]|nr:M23 family metallopeptidase [Sphingomicrobium sp.]